MINVSTVTPDYSAEALAEPRPLTDPVALETPLLAAPAKSVQASTLLPTIRGYITRNPGTAILAAMTLGFVVMRSLSRDR
jgi:hypothetical protein